MLDKNDISSSFSSIMIERKLYAFHNTMKEVSQNLSFAYGSILYINLNLQKKNVFMLVIMISKIRPMFWLMTFVESKVVRLLITSLFFFNLAFSDGGMARIGFIQVTRGRCNVEDSIYSFIMRLQTFHPQKRGSV